MLTWVYRLAVNPETQFGFVVGCFENFCIENSLCELQRLSYVMLNGWRLELLLLDEVECISFSSSTFLSFVQVTNADIIFTIPCSLLWKSSSSMAVVTTIITAPLRNMLFGKWRRGEREKSPEREGFGKSCVWMDEDDDGDAWVQPSVLWSVYILSTKYSFFVAVSVAVHFLVSMMLMFLKSREKLSVCCSLALLPEYFLSVLFNTLTELRNISSVYLYFWYNKLQDCKSRSNNRDFHFTGTTKYKRLF